MMYSAKHQSPGDNTHVQLTEEIMDQIRLIRYFTANKEGKKIWVLLDTDVYTVYHRKRTEDCLEDS